MRKESKIGDIQLQIQMILCGRLKEERQIRQEPFGYFRLEKVRDKNRELTMMTMFHESLEDI